MKKGNIMTKADVESFAKTCTFEQGRRFYGMLEAMPIEWPQGSGSGPMGLTPDHIRATQAWKAANAASNQKQGFIRAFNGIFCKRFKKELRAERDAKRDSRFIQPTE